LINNDMKKMSPLISQLELIERRAAQRRSVVGRLQYQLKEKKRNKTDILIDPIYPVMMDC